MGNCLNNRKGFPVTKGPPPSDHPPQICADHQAGIDCMAVSPDGSVVVTGSDDCTGRIWTLDKSTGKFGCAHNLTGHTEYVRCISVEGDYVVTGSADGTVRKWLVTTGQCVHVYRGHTRGINRLVCTNDFIFTSSIDTTAKCWQLDTTYGKGGPDGNFCLRTFEGHEKAVFPLIFIPMQIERRSRTENDDEDGDIRRVTKERLVTGSADCTARLWSIVDGRCLVRFKGHTGPVHCLSVDQYGETLFTGSADKTIRSWDLERGGQALRVFEGHDKEVLSILTFKRLLYSSSADGTVKLWITDFGELARTLKGQSAGIGCMVYENGFLFTGCGDAVVRMYDVRSGSIKFTFKGHQRAINCVKVVKGRLFTGSEDGTMRIWKLEDICER